jgi:Tol biopolymer transport system component
MSDPRIQERLHRAADPLPVDVTGRLEATRRRAHARQVRRRVGAGVVAAVIGLAAVAAIWSLRLGDDATPAVPVGLGGAIVYAPASNLEAEIPELRVLIPGSDEGASSLHPSGGWWSVSPDGTGIASFVETGRERDGYQLTDLVLQPVPDGPVRVLVHDVISAGPPAWGPDGRLAFWSLAADGRSYEILVREPDGTTGEPVIHAQSPFGLAWSPDGSTFAIAAGALGDELVLARPDGSKWRGVPLPEGEDPSHLAWSPDGSALAFTTRSTVPGGQSLDIWVVSADGTDPHAVTPEGSSEGVPVWSPDGSWIAFSSDRDASAEQKAANDAGEPGGGYGLYVMRHDGTEVHRLVEPSEGRGLNSPVAWLTSDPLAPMGSSEPPVALEPPGAIVWAHKGVAGPKDTGLPHVYVQAADGSDEPVEIEDPPWLWSPDGTRMLWEEYRGNQLSDFVVGGLDRSSPVIVATENAMDIRWIEWSPDGNGIAYTVGGEVHVVDTVTGEETAVIERPGVVGVDWSPDGSRLVIGVTDEEGADPGVFTMDPDGSNEELLFDRSTLEVAWSPAGDTIATYSQRVEPKDGYDLWLIAMDGSGAQVLLDGSYPFWSPDGRWLAYTAPDPDSDDEQPDALYVARADGTDVRKVVPDPGEGWPIPWAWLDRWPL